MAATVKLGLNGYAQGFNRHLRNLLRTRFVAATNVWLPVGCYIALMSILYLLTAPPPPIEGTDAVFQEVTSLRAAFQGEVANLSPLTTSTCRFPKQLFGFHNVRQLKLLERQCRLNHLFFSLLYPFPILRLLCNPVIYTVTASLDVGRAPLARDRLQRLSRIVVSNQRDASVLKAWGLTNYAIIPAGVTSPRVVSTARPPNEELTLLMASAPWIGNQFDSKGVDLLLGAAATLPFLRLILLWRGVLADELARRVARLGIDNRVEIVNRKVDVGDYLTRAHAAVVLAKNGGLVRAFPHSLIESLLAGKPVLLSNTIAMADYVSARDCGIVIPAMNLRALTSAIGTLMLNYGTLSRNAAQIGPGEFSITALVENYRRLYAS